MTTTAVPAEPGSKWSALEKEAIRDPRMMECATAEEFIAEMGKLTGVIRTAGGYRYQLGEIGRDGIDVNRTIYAGMKRLQNLAARGGEEPDTVASADENQTKENKNQPIYQRKLAMSEAANGHKWATSYVIAWLLGVSHSRVHQLVHESVLSSAVNPHGAGGLYKVADAIAYLRLSSSTKKSSQVISLSDAAEILGVSEKAAENQLFHYEKPLGYPGAHYFRADVVELWTKTPTSPLSNPNVPAIPPPSASSKKPMPAAKSASKPAAKPKNAKEHGDAATAADIKQIIGEANGSIADHEIKTLKWMIEGRRLGAIDKDQFAEFAERLAERD